jgi:hypothetical protein
MPQNVLQFERPLLQMGSIAFLAGIVIVIVSTGFHPSREDPTNHSLIFMEYANSDPWIAVHIGQFAGGIVVFAGGFSSLPVTCALRIKHNICPGLSWLCSCNNDSQCLCHSSGCRRNRTQDGSGFLGWVLLVYRTFLRLLEKRQQ